MIELFLSFLRIGFTSFGGLSMIPLLISEMESHGWMTAQEVLDIVGLAEVTPGPNGLNCATFAGMRVGGIFGAVMANLGVLTPTFTLFAIAVAGFERFKNNTLVQRMLTGIRPACIGIILAALVSLSQANFLPDGVAYLPSIAIAVIVGLCMWKMKANIAVALLIGAVLGVIMT